MTASSPRPRQRLASVDLIGFDTSGWANTHDRAKGDASEGRARMAVSAKVGEKTGVKAAPPSLG